MESKEELFYRYHPEIVGDYFDKGYSFDLEEEYFDIAWPYPIVVSVVISLYKLGYNILSLNVMIADKSENNCNKINLMYAGRSWRIGIPNREWEQGQLYDPAKQDMGLYGCLCYLDNFYRKNKLTMSNYYFHLYFSRNKF